VRPRAAGTTYTPTPRGPRAPSAAPLRAALYARVSTGEQTPENQLVALRAFTTARGWEPTEFVDHGVSGAKDRRPALDALLAAVRARQVDRVVCVRLDRLARSTRHLVALAADFEASRRRLGCARPGD
jgi:DNA invertase Pin-like site-specific DNA recombinase